MNETLGNLVEQLDDAALAFGLVQAEALLAEALTWRPVALTGGNGDKR